jgi:PilZ domain
MTRTGESERRRNPRLFLTAPLCFEWHQGAEIRRTRGTTRDVSRSGVYGFVENPLSPGLEVEFDLVFPEELTATQPLLLRCGGQILRAEVRERRFGVVASVERYDISAANEPASESERRSHLRIIPQQAVVAEYPGLRSVIRDLSRTGAFVEDERPFPVGHVIDVRLRGEGLERPLNVKAVVRRVEPQIGMAVEFIALKHEDRLQLLHFIERSRKPQPEEAKDPF